ncbi:hypothetical protein [Micromonospora sp. NBC_01813]|uniref:hypothetical protein n=1 Tax=Micromonospora sp. NBC_01813 TaxID=2975988 RepID=UPI002DD8FE67|nr:hypothetical protein [Micromonospora sp. NBC_01813]WSA11195.1 hypothetical protein OG958_10690 [Micromonospora sp. NBC_01813]
MSSYTITIAPDDESRATTTLRVEVTGAGARITELLVRAGTGAGLAPGQLPSVNVEQLLRSIVGQPDEPAFEPDEPAIEALPTPVALTSTADHPAAPDSSVPEAAARAAKKTAAVRGTTPARTRDATTRKPARQKASTVRKPAPQKTATVRKPVQQKTAQQKMVAVRQPAAGRKATPVKRTDGTGRTTQPVTARSYRRAPQDLGAVFDRVGSVGAVATHYAVPRHTAQSWVRTLRRRQEAGSA